ncbi:MAG: nitroreductase family deazaflavin-dependent oxidoreductase [Solirubrobacteraceae bacterium]
MSTPIPRVDPLAPQGALRRGYAAFLRTRAGRWLGINAAARFDPALMRISRGYVGMGVMFPSVNLTTTGAKSGQPRVATVLYFNDASDVILIASSFGREKHPAWYHNLKAHPEATLESRGRAARYRAEEVHESDERARLWDMADRIYPGYADYRVRVRKIGRTIPIMRLRAL